MCYKYMDEFFLESYKMMKRISEKEVDKNIKKF